MRKEFKYIILALLIIAIIVISTYTVKAAGTGTLDLALEGEISKLHPKEKDRFRKFIRKVMDRGYIVHITDGYRTYQEQAVNHQANTKNAKPGYSLHEYGLALDINLEKDGKQWKKATNKAEWEATGVPDIGKNLGLSWGGDYNNYHDPVHFEVDKYNSTELFQKALGQFGSVLNIQGNKVQI